MGRQTIISFQYCRQQQLTGGLAAQVGWLGQMVIQEYLYSALRNEKTLSARQQLLGAVLHLSHENR